MFVKFFKISAALMAIALSANASQAAGAQCGGTYTIVKGDTLRSIAKRVYGTDISYQLLFSANISIIGANPNKIEPGMQIAVPCFGDAYVPPQVAGAAPVSAAPPVTTITFVAGNEYPPFTDEALENGGMLVEMIDTALNSVGGGVPHRIDFVNDWGAHFDPLLSNNVYDFSIAWTAPNCEIVSERDADSAYRCANLKFSDALFEEIALFYVNPRYANVQTHAELKGLRLCEADGWNAGLLMAEGGMSDGDVVISPLLSDPKDCLTGVAQGDYDFAVFPAESADLWITELGLTDKVLAPDALAVSTKIAAAIGASNPRREELLATLNTGLEAIKRDGKWFEIVSRHLMSHRAKQ